MKKLKYLFILFVFFISTSVFASNYFKSIYLNGKEFTNSFTTVYTRKVEINYGIYTDSINANNVSLSFCSDTHISNIKSTLRNTLGISFYPQKDFEIIETGSPCMYSNSSYTGGKITIIKFTHVFKDFDCNNGHPDATCVGVANFSFDISSDASFQLLKSTVSFDKTSDSSLQLAEAEKTRKGILKTLIDLPKNIVNLFIDGFKKLFIPSNTFFKDKFNDLNTFFSKKLGILFYPFELFKDFINLLLEFSSKGDGIIKIPDIREPFSKNILIKATNYNFGQDFKTVLGDYYGLYQASMYAIFFLLFINFIRKYWADIVEGN